MYIGRYSVEALFMFLGGYTAAVQNQSDVSLTQYREFIDGLYAKYGFGGGGHSWAWVLGQKAGGDAAGLDLFFAELEAFQNKPGNASVARDQAGE
jgi:hypothetical protein